MPSLTSAWSYWKMASSAATSKDAHLYKKIPPRIEATNSRELGMQPLPDSPEKFIEAFLTSRVDSRKVKGGLLGQLRVQTMLLNPLYKAPKVTTPYRPPKKLSSRQKREMKIYEIPKEQQVYELYLPLHELWLGYMRDLLQLGPGKKDMNQMELNRRVMKADYHGAILKVGRSKCPSYIGVEGILLRETQNTLQLISTDNKMRTIPKANSIFTFKVDRYQFSLHGNYMKFKASERSARKFKDKPTIDL